MPFSDYIQANRELKDNQCFAQSVQHVLSRTQTTNVEKT